MATELHLSIAGKAACDARPLDPGLTIDSPECRDLAPCRSCLALQAHFIREGVVGLAEELDQ